MPRKPAQPKPPAGLGKPGRALWRAIVGDLADGWELDARELHLLDQAARCADRIAGLEQVVERDGPTVEGSRGQTVVHPAVAEARQLRLAELRLLRELRLDVAAEDSPGVRQARKAATARWDRRRRSAELREAG